MKKRAVLLLKMLAVAAALILLYHVIVENNGKEAEKKGTEQSSQPMVQTGPVYDTYYDFAMGTTIAVCLYEDDKEKAEKVSREIIEEMKALDKELSWRTEGSEIAVLNANYTAGEPMAVTENVYDVVALSLAVCEKSEGALDITLRPLMDLWGIETKTEKEFQVPTEEEIKAALANTGYEKVHAADGTVTIDEAGMMLDLGATAKGYALDAAAKVMEKEGITSGLIVCGGSVLVYDANPAGLDHMIGIRNPKGDAESSIANVRFRLTEYKGNAVYISTSGDYNKYIEKSGTRYHHIFDRNTGAPARSGLSSVTVVSENGTISDALSTACFVLGYEKSIPLLEEYDCEAIFIDEENHITVTPGLESKMLYDAE